MINFLEVLGSLKNAEDMVRCLTTYLRQLFQINDVVFILTFEGHFETFRLRDGRPLKKQHENNTGMAGKALDRKVDLLLQEGDGSPLWKGYDPSIDARCAPGDAMHMMLAKRGRMVSCAVQWTIPKQGARAGHGSQSRLTKSRNAEVLQRFIQTLGDVVEVQFPILERMESSLRKKLKPKANVLGLLKFHRAEHGHDKQEELSPEEMKLVEEEKVVEEKEAVVDDVDPNLPDVKDLGPEELMKESLEAERQAKEAEAQLRALAKGEEVDVDVPAVASPDERRWTTVAKDIKPEDEEPGDYL